MRIVVSAPAVSVAAVLSRDGTDVVPLTLVDLASATGFSPHTIYKALRELDELGALVLVHDDRDGRRPVRAAELNHAHWLFAAAAQLGGAA